MADLTEIAGRLEGLHLFRDQASGLRAVIAVHDTRRGPPRGGTRLRAYASLAEAADDAARLAQGMSYKFAVHGVPYGGGKGVILQDEAGAKDRPLLEERLRAYGRCLERLGGHFATGPDYGISSREVDVIREVTSLAIGEHGSQAGPATAAGVRVCLEAGFARLGLELAGRRILVQGVGTVGGALARQLQAAGASVLISDPAPAGVALAAELGVDFVAPEDALWADVDALAPCAVGGVFDGATIAGLRCRLVAGAANDQLVGGAQAADAFAERGVLYLPDFVVNGGAAVLLTARLENGSEPEVEVAEARIRATIAEVLRRADGGLTPYAAAVELAEERLGD
ncbi:MAG: Glu/Leu/Phe/Val dehydrogenase [Planctomycetes bacterium]|nr:Glu/Leu/Phe/Val dehydrogenase [Planctomycetota bacterium]